MIDPFFSLGLVVCSIVGIVLQAVSGAERQVQVQPRPDDSRYPQGPGSSGSSWGSLWRRLPAGHQHPAGCPTLPPDRPLGGAAKDEEDLHAHQPQQRRTTQRASNNEENAAAAIQQQNPQDLTRPPVASESSTMPLVNTETARQHTQQQQQQRQKVRKKKRVDKERNSRTKTADGKDDTNRRIRDHINDNYDDDDDGSEIYNNDNRDDESDQEHSDHYSTDGEAAVDPGRSPAIPLPRTRSRRHRAASDCAAQGISNDKLLASSCNEAEQRKIIVNAEAATAVEEEAQADDSCCVGEIDDDFVETNLFAPPAGEQQQGNNNNTNSIDPKAAAGLLLRHGLQGALAAAYTPVAVTVKYESPRVLRTSRSAGQVGVHFEGPKIIGIESPLYECLRRVASPTGVFRATVTDDPCWRLPFPQRAGLQSKATATTSAPAMMRRRLPQAGSSSRRTTSRVAVPAPKETPLSKFDALRALTAAAAAGATSEGSRREGGDARDATPAAHESLVDGPARILGIATNAHTSANDRVDRGDAAAAVVASDSPAASTRCWSPLMGLRRCQSELVTTPPVHLLACDGPRRCRAHSWPRLVHYNLREANDDALLPADSSSHPRDDLCSLHPAPTPSLVPSPVDLHGDPLSNEGEGGDAPVGVDVPLSSSVGEAGALDILDTQLTDNLLMVAVADMRTESVARETSSFQWPEIPTQLSSSSSEPPRKSSSSAASLTSEEQSNCSTTIQQQWVRHVQLPMGKRVVLATAALPVRVTSFDDSPPPPRRAQTAVRAKRLTTTAAAAEPAFREGAVSPRTQLKRWRAQQRRWPARHGVERHLRSFLHDWQANRGVCCAEAVERIVVLRREQEQLENTFVTMVAVWDALVNSHANDFLPDKEQLFVSKVGAELDRHQEYLADLHKRLEKVDRELTRRQADASSTAPIQPQKHQNGKPPLARASSQVARALLSSGSVTATQQERLQRRSNAANDDNSHPPLFPSLSMAGGNRAETFYLRNRLVVLRNQWFAKVDEVTPLLQALESSSSSSSSSRPCSA